MFKQSKVKGIRIALKEWENLNHISLHKTVKNVTVSHGIWHPIYDQPPWLVLALETYLKGPAPPPGTSLISVYLGICRNIQTCLITSSM